MAALQYLESLRNAHPELSDWYNTLSDLYQKKLWRQFTLKLKQLFALAPLNPALRPANTLPLLHNRFAGPIPPAVSKLELLSYLDHSESKLNGSTPESMAKLRRLMFLDLSHNHLTGPILGSVIASLKSMQIYFNFPYNFLVGKIPDELGLLGMVQAIDISNNNLPGSTPRTPESCKNLFSLDLSGNKLSGPIPSNTLSQIDMMRSLNLSRNQLYGCTLALIPSPFWPSSSIICSSSKRKRFFAPASTPETLSV
ncbi:hypothetical protein F0562_001513 [Nyssa sinensis]|uniref:Uncharacterized protein n=1 Tax=Nyssa sinensis TaxID=561372 RepID=A0A5J5C3W3_9ASTE|nr:hypothetical protein F0562_001513 [Nyssa sinensis]